MRCVTSYAPLTTLPSCLHFFFSHPVPTEFYTLSLHDALPIFVGATPEPAWGGPFAGGLLAVPPKDRKSTRLNSSHLGISYAVFCLKKKRRRQGASAVSTRWQPRRNQRNRQGMC